MSIDAHALVLSVELFPLLHRRLVVRQITLEGGEIALGSNSSRSVAQGYCRWTWAAQDSN